MHNEEILSDENKQDEKILFSGTKKNREKHRVQNFWNRLLIKGKKEVSMQEETLDLIHAYNLLNIKFFPVSYEDVRMAYYMQELTVRDDEKHIQLLKRARKLIFDNINICPFEEDGQSIKEVNESDEMNEECQAQINNLMSCNPKKESWFRKRINKSKFKKKHKKREKANWTDVENELNNFQKEDIQTNFAGRNEEINNTIKKVKPSKKSGMVFILIVSVFILLNYYMFQQQIPVQKEKGLISLEQLNKENVEEEQSEKFNVNDREDYISVTRSIELLQRDGLKVDRKQIGFNINEITDFESTQILRVPFINICLLKREFTVNKSYISYRLTDYSLYKFIGANEPEMMWHHKGNISTYKILEYGLTGTWKGTCTTGSGKYKLSNVVLNMETTENGYINAELSFHTGQGLPGKVNMEGQYDSSKNRFVLHTTEWEQRPLLFVAPELCGRIDLEENILTQTINTTKTTFSLMGETSVKGEQKITKEVISTLLSKEIAEYNKTQISMKDIRSCTINAIKQNEEDFVVSITAFLDRRMIDFNVSGKVVVEQINGIWILKDCFLKAFPAKKDYTGVYRGTEIIDKTSYNVVYEVTSSDGNTNQYEVIVTRKHRLLPIVIINKEKRLITINGNEFICERIDVLQGEIIGDSKIVAYINYVNDSIENENILLMK